MFRLYLLSIRLYGLAARVYARWNRKAALWVEGQRMWPKAIAERKPADRYIWFHCASVGEFEQARPVIEGWKATHPNDRIALTFFSPSGYELRKNYVLADMVTYLPLDAPENAIAFLEQVKPAMAVFVKYELWFAFMQTLSDMGIPAILISAHFPERHWLFRWPGTRFIERLHQFDRIFVQGTASLERLQQRGFHHVVVNGDTRVDRVIATRDEPWQHQALSSWAETSVPVVVVGSNWPSDDQHILPTLKSHVEHLRIIVAPHEMNDHQWVGWQRVYEGQILRWSEVGESIPEHIQVVYIDTVGLLSKLYRYATLAYVGGGFGAAVHNTLEAAVYGAPVICGPNNARFQEIQDLKECGVIFEVDDDRSFQSALSQALSEEHRAMVALQAAAYFQQHAGASERILHWMRERLG